MMSINQNMKQQLIDSIKEYISQLNPKPSSLKILQICQKVYNHYREYLIDDEYFNIDYEEPFDENEYEYDPYYYYYDDDDDFYPDDDYYDNNFDTSFDDDYYDHNFDTSFNDYYDPYDDYDFEYNRYIKNNGNVSRRFYYEHIKINNQ